jgi:DNA-binding MarR family transcriptional regulator
MNALPANKLGAIGVLLGDAMAEAVRDLSPSAAALLLTLRYRGVMTGTALAAIGGISQPTAARITGGLVRRGLVERGNRKGRIAPLRLTRAGAQLAGALQRARLDAMAHLLEVLSEMERTAFERTLDKILAHATGSCAFARTICRFCDHALCKGRLCPVGTKAATLELGAQKLSKA